MDFWVIILAIACLGAYFYLPASSETAPEHPTAPEPRTAQDLRQAAAAALKALQRVKIEHLVGFAVLAAGWIISVGRRS